jgi:hypothetical protein
VRTRASYLLAALAVLSALWSLRANTLLNHPELEPAPVEWVGLEGGTLTLSGEPGERVEFRFESVGVGGHWASPNGLSISLEEPESNFRAELPLLAPRARDWDRVVSHRGSSDDRVSIPVSLQLPPDPRFVHRRLRGIIKGSVEIPRIAGGSGFRTETIPVYKVIGVHVVAPEESHRARTLRRARLELLCGLAACVGLAGSAAYLRFGRRSQA